ncbi:MAG: cytochrome c-type biogenesis protein CcmH [Halomonas sp.]|jgi:cytochrome c-type biogenesis protein CcmH|uniref:Cytochrome c-type biogenesis protein n=1 Tax=Billgrantia tianxiuensis TaxID=2497861 RepID=A0A6I6SKF2_9GAMM|nr:MULTISPECIES: cytochrome c-type biogenesis protein [Halomonas]MCE8033090.1 cytochrome c-type biogenesis protein CcmH [Halomonas sp. MCCC 1A11057]MDX5434262.1 cytochrome c-type biogenesis protein CcmH [Halomonas sp.]QHC48864.1 cytochrome c-type biogenesis protein CcmH [Halomonas tianxiuensis]
MAVIRLAFVGILMLLVAATVQAAIEVREFDDPVLEQRYRSLTASLRCPTCENQAINDSNAPVSGDMRDRVYLLLQDGRSDMEIRDHMVQRFGDYVLYNPRLEGRTFLLWGLPAGLVVAGGILVALVVRARRNASARELSAEERARLDALINRGRPE